MSDTLFRQVCLDCGEPVHSTDGHFEPHYCNYYAEDNDNEENE